MLNDSRSGDLTFISAFGQGEGHGRLVLEDEIGVCNRDVTVLFEYLTSIVMCVEYELT